MTIRLCALHAMFFAVIMTMSCAHQLPPIPAAPSQVTEVILPTFVDDSARFCIENLYGNGTTVCAWSVRQVREWARHQRAADE